MGQSSCCMCGKALGFFSSKYALQDGCICSKCVKTGGMNALSSSDKLSVKQITEFISSRRDAVLNFRATKTYHDLEIDANSNTFKLEGTLYFFDELLSYTYREDPDNSRRQLHKGQTSGAAIGGAIGGLRGGIVGGAIGAAVGGKIGSLISTTCNYMYISVAIKGALVTDIRLNFIREKTRVSSEEYIQAAKRAQDCVEGLQMIIDHNNAKKEAVALEKRQHGSKNVFIQNGHLTAAEFAEELAIYRQLLKDGDITQEEFDAKKKQLIDMM